MTDKTKDIMITARITEHEMRLLADLQELMEKDRSEIVRFAIKSLWFAQFVSKEELRDLL